MRKQFSYLNDRLVGIAGALLVLSALLTFLVLATLGASWRDIKLAIPVLYYKAEHDAPYQWAGCARFRCNSNVAQCDNADPTDFSGDERHPPCCIHLLRDMLKTLDEEFRNAGIDYYTSRGALLGLVRSDRLIPWTADNDISFTEEEIRKVENPKFNQSLRMRGLGLISELIDRVCFTEDYFGGILAKWPDPFPRAIYREKYPYSDLYPEGLDKDTKKYPDTVSIIGCRYRMSTLYPTKRLKVYGDSFSVSVPNKVDQYLNYTYGEDWRVPDPQRNGFGSHMSYCHDQDPNIVG